MFVGVLRLEFRINTMITSLKDKRRVVKSIKDKLRNTFNVSVSEVDALDNYYEGVLGISIVSNDRKAVDATLNKITESLENHASVTLEKVETEII